MISADSSEEESDQFQSIDQISNYSNNHSNLIENNSSNSNNSSNDSNSSSSNYFDLNNSSFSDYSYNSDDSDDFQVYLPNDEFQNELDPVLEVDIYLENQAVLQRQQKKTVNKCRNYFYISIAICTIIQSAANMLIIFYILFKMDYENTDQSCNTSVIFSALYPLLIQETLKILGFLMILFIPYDMYHKFYSVSKYWSWLKISTYIIFIFSSIVITILLYIYPQCTYGIKEKSIILFLMISHNCYTGLILGNGLVIIGGYLIRYCQKKSEKNQIRVWLQNYSETKRFGKWVDIDESRCSICLETYRNRDKVCKLNCQHEFHQNCINKWVRKEKKNNCPICKQKIHLGISYKKIYKKSKVIEV